MRPYHPDNIKFTGRPYWRLALLAWVGKLLDIQFKVEGMPFGGSYKNYHGELENSSMTFGSYNGGETTRR